MRIGTSGHRAAHDAVAFESARCLGQHLAREALDAPAQFREACLVAQNADDEDGPPVADAVEDVPGAQPAW